LLGYDYEQTQLPGQKAGMSEPTLTGVYIFVFCPASAYFFNPLKIRMLKKNYEQPLLSAEVMKKHFFTMKTLSSCLTMLLLATSLHATIFYVKQDCTGRGTSWKDASGDLNAVLFAANYGDEIWVAEGIYYPTRSTEREVAFVVPDGVRVYGGFKGYETKRSARNWRTNKTILSGEIGTSDFRDNAFTVVYFKNTSSETILDGFIISNGCANQPGDYGARQKAGGGLYVDGSGKGNLAAPVIRNCHLINNYARDGAAVYNNGADGGAARPVFENCKFINNRADLDGGAIFNDGRRNGDGSPLLTNCLFFENEGNFGGAFMNYGAGGKAFPVFENCRFERNEAYNKGGAIFNMDYQGVAAIDCRNCGFDENTPDSSADLTKKIAGSEE